MRARRPTTQIAFDALPNSGRVWARSSARPSTWRWASASVMSKRCRIEAPAAFVGVALADAFEVVARRSKSREVGHRQQIEIEEGDRIGAGVVESAQEPGIAGDRQAALGQHVADAQIVEHGGHRPGVGTAGVPRASPAIVGRLVRIVEAVRSVAQEQHQPGEAARQADVAQHPFAEIAHLFQRKPDLVFFHSGGRRGRAPTAAG